MLRYQTFLGGLSSGLAPPRPPNSVALDLTASGSVLGALHGDVVDLFAPFDTPARTSVSVGDTAATRLSRRLSAIAACRISCGLSVTPCYTHPAEGVTWFCRRPVLVTPVLSGGPGACADG
jgi:hypothetical protein